MKDLENKGMISGAIFTYAFIAGLFGAGVRFYIAGFLTSDESIRHPKRYRRYFFRYAVFSMSYFASFIVTALIAKPIGLDKLIDVEGFDGQLKGWLFFASCLPLAALFFAFSYRGIVRADRMKIWGRKMAKRRWG